LLSNKIKLATDAGCGLGLNKACGSLNQLVLVEVVVALVQTLNNELMLHSIL
jgi:hypothetical protein